MWLGWFIGVALAGGGARPADRLDAAELRIAQLEQTLAELVAGESEHVAHHAAHEGELHGLGQALTVAQREIHDLHAELDGLRVALETPASKTGARLALLEAEVKRLTEAAAIAPKTPATPSATDEDAATASLARAKDHALQFDLAAAQKELDALAAKYPDTRANRSAERLRGELAVVGRRPGEPTVSKWFTQPTTASPCSCSGRSGVRIASANSPDSPSGSTPTARRGCRSWRSPE